jgi:O-antigen ligase
MSGRLVKNDRVGFIAPALIVLVLSLMVAEALGIAPNFTGIRNVFAAILVPLLVLRFFRRFDGNSQGTWLALGMFVLAVWVATRIIYDDGFFISGLTSALWFPVVFFLAYYNTSLTQGTLSLFSYYAIFASFAYVVVAVTTGLAGPQAINSVYYSVLALPYIVAKPRGPLTVVALFSVLVATLISEKRAAFIAVVVALLFAMLANRASKTRSHPRLSGRVSALIIIPAGIAAYWTIDTRLDIDVVAKLSELAEDDGSGRGDVFATVIRLIRSQDFSGFLMGNGQGAVAETIGISAHNDFLETSYNFGFIGLLLLVGVVIACFASIASMIQSGNLLSGGMAAALGLFLVMALFSHVVFVPTYVALIAYFWGSAVSPTPIARTQDRQPCQMVNNRLGGIR